MALAFVEVGEKFVRTVLIFAPWLTEVPVLGRILLSIAPGGGNEFEALEEFERVLQEKATERATRIQRNARYVLKASDAMKCVEDNFATAGFLFALVKGILNTLIGRGAGGSAVDLLEDRMFTCIESKVLKQTGRRQRKEKTYYGRPARGHGHGRVKS